MEAAAVELAGSDALEQAQVGDPVRPVERHRFRRRRLPVAQVTRPVVLIDRREDGFLVRNDLADAIAIHDLHIAEVRQDLEDRPLVRRGLPAQRRLIETGYRSGDHVRTLLRGVKACSELVLRHEVISSTTKREICSQRAKILSP